jgi:hypothetical protein
LRRAGAPQPKPTQPLVPLLLLKLKTFILSDNHNDEFLRPSGLYLHTLNLARDDKMPFKVEKNEAIGCIELTYSRQTSPKETIQSIHSAFSLAQEAGLHCYLVHLHLKEPQVSLLDLFEIPMTWKKMGVGRHHATAIICPPASSLFSDMSFLENTANNYGWNVKLFSEEESAIIWLKEIQANRSS